MESNKMVFYTPKEAFSNIVDQEQNLQVYFYFLRDKFKIAFKSVPDTLSTKNITKYFRYLRRESGTQQRFIMVREDLTKPH